MKATHYDSRQLLSFDPLIKQYLDQSERIAPLISAFPDFTTFSDAMNARQLNTDQRRVLSETILSQYLELRPGDLTSEHILALQEEDTFTVTTGHQLCLFTGPLYFIYKIVSTIKLAHQLSEKFPDKRFVPVYWLASEDHDYEEIRSAYLFGKKIDWDAHQSGAVGAMTTDGIESAISQFAALLGESDQAKTIVTLLSKGYKHKNLADATRALVHELFGQYGLVVVDGNDAGLKALFKKTMADELLHSRSVKAVNDTNSFFVENGFRVQVNPREINLFYLTQNERRRIERSTEFSWKVVDSEIHWDEAALFEELNNHPERFSPNVILRPLYQETILPNLAYIGGPGELAYWLQLKAMFQVNDVPFPLLILRDSALILSTGANSKMEKLGLSVVDLFRDKNELLKSIIQTPEASLQSEKNKLVEVFDEAASKAKSIDVTLENTVKAELQKAISSLENLEKKMLKAIKVKEESKIAQLDKLWNDVFPEGVLQERHDNYFQFNLLAGDGLIDELLLNFEPLESRLTVLSI